MIKILKAIYFRFYSKFFWTCYKLLLKSIWFKDLVWYCNVWKKYFNENPGSSFSFKKTTYRYLISCSKKQHSHGFHKISLSTKLYFLPFPFLKMVIIWVSRLISWAYLYQNYYLQLIWPSRKSWFLVLRRIAASTACKHRQILQQFFRCYSRSVEKTFFRLTWTNFDNQWSNSTSLAFPTSKGTESWLSAIAPFCQYMMYNAWQCTKTQISRFTMNRCTFYALQHFCLKCFSCRPKIYFHILVVVKACFVNSTTPHAKLFAFLIEAAGIGGS